MSEVQQETFRVDLRLLHELGERLISRDEVAILELVKNSYDADATKVEVKVEKNRLEIRDNGQGMSLDDIREGWLTIGSSVKKRQSTSKKGRRVLGEKGLGRLAVLRLGKSISIFTQKKGESCYKIFMNWEKTRSEIASSRTYSPIANMQIEIREITADMTNILPEGHGTVIKIDSSRIEFEKNEINKLKTFLATLIEPGLYGVTDFEIFLSAHNEKIKLEPPEIIKNPHYQFDITIDSDGKYSGTIKWKMEKGEGSDSINGVLKNWIKIQDEPEYSQENYYGCGPFVINFNVWDLDAKEIKGSRSILKDWTGLSLVRDGFRVVLPNTDWLGLDLRRIQNPTLRLSSNQMRGAVYITSAKNWTLIDKTDREGLLENRGFQNFKLAISEILGVLERKRYTLRHEKTLSRGVVLTTLDTRQLKTIAKNLPVENRTEIEEYADNVDRFRTMLEEWMMGRDRMATLGMLGSRLIHEARNSLSKITDAYPLLRKDAEHLEPPVRERIERMVEGGQMLARIFNELNPFMKFRQKDARDIKLILVLNSLETLFKPDLNKHHITFVKKVPENLMIHANVTDIFVLLSNFLDNSIFWLAEGGNDEKIIECRISQNSGEIVIEIADNGPGIDPEIIDDVFDSGISRKPDGFGLGLSIVKDIVDYYGGTVIAGEDAALKGAMFRVKIPLKK